MSDVAKFGENSGDTDSTQPKPEPSINSMSVTDAVVEDLKQRRDHGRKKYGVELLTYNGRDPVLDAYQEVLDAAVYLKQILMERTVVMAAARTEYRSWDANPHGFVLDTGTGACAVCGYGPGAIFHNSFEIEKRSSKK